MRSWVRRLAALRVILGLLMVSRNVLEGVVLSNCSILLPRAVVFQLSFHLSFICAAWCCLSAEELVVSLFRSRSGRSLFIEVVPFAAAFASLSANSFPFIPLCPAVHL